MSVLAPELEVVDTSGSSLRYLEHGWPTKLCRWHCHEECELHLVLESSGKALIGDHIGRFSPGQLFLTGPMLPHNWVSTSKGRIEIPVRDMLVQFARGTLTRAADAIPEFGQFEELFDMSERGIEFVGFDPGEAKGRLESIRDASGLQRLSNFLGFLIRLRNWPDKRLLSSVRLAPKGNGDAHDRIGRVVDHVVGHFDGELDATSMAQIAGMNRKTFSNQFRIQTGNRFKDFVNRVRVGQACVLLLESNLQISAVGQEVGYRNMANFNRNFLRYVGMSPSEFRRARYLDGGLAGSNGAQG